eukprot:9205354-Pyramimonas_sp.AAC.1
MEVGRSPSTEHFGRSPSTGGCVDNVAVMQRRRETPRSSSCAPPRGYFATIAPTARQLEKVCEE